MLPGDSDENIWDHSQNGSSVVLLVCSLSISSIKPLRDRSTNTGWRSDKSPFLIFFPSSWCDTLWCGEKKKEKKTLGILASEQAGYETETISRGTYFTCELSVLTDSDSSAIIWIIVELSPPPTKPPSIQLINQLLFLLSWIRYADTPRLSAHAVLAWTATPRVFERKIEFCHNRHRSPKMAPNWAKVASNHKVRKDCPNWKWTETFLTEIKWYPTAAYQ